MKFILFAFLLITTAAHARESCVHFLSDQNDNTVSLVAYLSRIYEEQVITKYQLQKMLDAINEQHTAINPITTINNYAASVHQNLINQYLQTDLDINKLSLWLTTKLELIASTDEARDHAIIETLSIHIPMTFSRVEPITFEIKSNGGPKIIISLTHPMEVLNTKITQAMWVKIMGENPSHHTNMDTNEMLPDHPVENITWLSALYFANALSMSKKLLPAYDLSKIKLKKGTRAEDGTAHAVSGKVRINAPKGDIYQTEGYRLPTLMEQKRLLSARGKANNFQKFAWYGVNTNFETQGIAELAPFVIDGHSFFDLYGNVHELAHDTPDNSSLTIDPVGELPKDRYYFSGGCYLSSIRQLESPTGSAEIEQHHENVGLRLVRTVK